MLFLDIDCKNLWPIIHLIKDGLIPIIQIGIPVILIILGMIDLGKAVIASKEDEIKSAQKLLIKRIIYAVAIFLVVSIVTLVFSVVAGNTDNDNQTDAQKWSDCWACTNADCTKTSTKIEPKVDKPGVGETTK